MIIYANGTTAMVGDEVLFEQGQISGTVELVVITAKEMADIGVEEPGVMLISAPFGRVYLPESSLQTDPLESVIRGPLS